MKDFLGFLLLLLPVFAHGSFRIVGGDITDISEVPYVASVLNDVGLCGGTIITDKSVLTAAHCFDENDPEKNLFVTVGSNFFDDENDETSYKAKKVFIHEKFSEDPPLNDIAVVYIESEFIFSDLVKKALLPQPNDFLEVGTVARVSGWGSEKHDEEIASEKLKSFYIEVTPQKRCDQIIARNYGKENVLNGSFFCAAKKDFKSNICSGDSGSGMVTDKNVVHGIVSWSVACGHRKIPTGFTRVAYYLDFIGDTYIKFFYG